MVKKSDYYALILLIVFAGLFSKLPNIFQGLNINVAENTYFNFAILLCFILVGITVNVRL